MCLLRNLSYQVHREIPHAERYQETPLVPTNNTGPHAASCFGAKKGKGWLAGGVMDLFQLQRGSRVVWDLCAAPLASLMRRLKRGFLWRRGGSFLPWLWELQLGLPEAFGPS